MRTKHALLILAGIVGGGGIVAAQQPAPADFLAMVLQQDQLLSAGVVGPILDYPRLTSADKELVAKAVKPMDDALAMMKQNAAANPTIAGIQADQQKVVQSSLPMMKLLEQRKDLMWISRRGKGMQEMKARMLQDKAGDYANLIKEAGADQAQVTSAKVVMDKFRADFDALAKQVATAPANGDMKQKMAQAGKLTETTLGALKAIDGVLTTEQRCALEWAVAKVMTDDEGPMFRILGYAAQPGMMAAPEAGTYQLKSERGAGSDDAKPRASVTLKKGDPIGFKTMEKGTMALAGDKSFDVPADVLAEVCWEFVPEKR